FVSSFFFQAEDGIRDFHVTGVQTCALPIYAIAGTVLPCLRRPAYRQALRVHRLPGRLRALRTPSSPIPLRCVRIPGGEAARCARSEERRVGKEGRSRAARAH